MGTHLLWHRAMQRCNGVALLGQRIGQTVGFYLSAGEDNRLLQFGITQVMIQQLFFVNHVVGPVQRLRNLGMTIRRTGQFQAARVLHQAGSQRHNARCECGREHEGLLTLLAQMVNVFQIFGKAQIQHTVGFINDQRLHVGQMNLAALSQIQQTARSGNHQKCATQTGHLLTIGHTTHHGRHADTLAVLEQVDGILSHLLCQFTRWAEYQRSWADHAMQVDGRVVATGHDGVDHRQQEGGGFTTTRLAAYHPVTPFNGGRNGFGLYRCRLGESQVLDGLQQRRSQTHARERAVCLFSHFLSPVRKTGRACLTRWSVVKRTSTIRQMPANPASGAP